MRLENSFRDFSGAVIRILIHPGFLTGCLLVWVLTRLILILVVPVQPTSDAEWYHVAATTISQGLGYLKNGEPTAFWPVGYPGFLGFFYWIFGPDVLVGQLLNLALSIAIFFLLLAISRRISSNEIVARIAVALLAFYPNYIGYTSLLLSETLFTSTLLLALWVYLRFAGASAVFFVGFLLGCLALIKAQALLAIPVLIGFDVLIVARGRERLQAMGRGAIICLLALFAILPWSYRNSQVFGEFVLNSTNGGISLLSGNNPSMRADYRTDFRDDDPLVRSLGHPHTNELIVDRRAKELAFDWISSNPQEFAILIPHKIWRLWGPDGEAEWSYQRMEDFYGDHMIAFRAIRIFNQAYYAALIIGALAFPFFVIRGHEVKISRWIWFGYVFALYTTAISVLFSGQSRYHFPAMSLLVINAAWTLWYLLSRFSARRQDKGSSDLTLGLSDER